jgi:U4/U6.U5 tri-snRNP component SNU23
LKDSMAYLDHINGKKQQKALGMSMVVERSSVEQVKNAFVNAKRKKQEAKVRGFSTQHVPPP